MEAGAEVLVLDMETNGGRFDSTKEIIQILDQFEGLTVTYVNRDAYSAGAFIAVATQQIYMAPQERDWSGSADHDDARRRWSGADAGDHGSEDDVGGGGPGASQRGEERAQPQVVEAMINKNKRLEIDGQVLNEEGQILTLTDVEAAASMGIRPSRCSPSARFLNLETSGRGTGIWTMPGWFAWSRRAPSGWLHG
jgi:membrane-bound serine protease (ClpP class)